MPMMRVPISLCVAGAAILSGCGTTGPSPVDPCSNTSITIGLPSNNSPASPGQGQVWTSYFAATVLPSTATVYIVDLNIAAACKAPWLAVSADTSAVQLSPASGIGRHQVELFMPTNTGAQRSTLVTIAGQTATIKQSGR
jgi:hypothetical protein